MTLQDVVRALDSHSVESIVVGAIVGVGQLFSITRQRRAAARRVVTELQMRDQIGAHEREDAARFKAILDAQEKLSSDVAYVRDRIDSMIDRALDKKTR